MKKNLLVLTGIVCSLGIKAQDPLLLSQLSFDDSGFCKLKNGWEVERIVIGRRPIGDPLATYHPTYWIDSANKIIYSYKKNNPFQEKDGWLIKSPTQQLYLSQEQVYYFSLIEKKLFHAYTKNCGFDILIRRRCGFKDAEIDLTKNTVTIIQQRRIGQRRLPPMKLY